MKQSIVTTSEAETARVARDLVPILGDGTVLLLFGDLGAGKTAFVRGLAEGAGIDEEEVSSPTFTLIQEYRGSRTLYHVDLYRVGGGEVDDLGLEELTAAGGLVAIEWADRLVRPIPGAISVRIEDLGGDRRRITIEDGSGECQV